MCPDDKSQNIEQAIKDTGYKPNFQMQKTPTDARSLLVSWYNTLIAPTPPVVSSTTWKKTLIAQGYSLVIATGHWQKKLMHALEYLRK